MGVSHILIVYIMTFWVKLKINEDNQQFAVMKRQTSERNSKYLPLVEILENPIGYELFMEQLCKEYSMENLLSVTEFLQFKCLLLSQHNLKEEEAVFPIDLPMEFIPKSSIVYAQYDMENDDLISDAATDDVIEDKDATTYAYGQIVYRLWNKYIRNGSELTINIGWESRQNIEKFIDKNRKCIHQNLLLNDAEYFGLFDECIAELLKLMQSDSHVRFLHTEEYKKFKNTLHHELPTHTLKTTLMTNGSKLAMSVRHMLD